MQSIRTWLIGSVLTLGAMTGGAAAAQTATAEAESEYANCHFKLALAQFEQRAASGDAIAAELAGQMLYYGELLYGNDVPRDREHARELLSQAALAGRPVARFLLARIDAPARSEHAQAADAGACTDAYVFGREGC
jgi:TPR repeat protein